MLLTHALRAVQKVEEITDLAQTATAQSSSSTTTYTFSSVNIGTANSNRIVVVCASFFGGNTTRFSSITIGGNTASLDKVQLLDGATVDAQTAIASHNLASGTTATIVLNLSGSAASFAGIIVYSFVSPNGQANVVDTYGDSDVSGGNVSDTTTTVDGGVIIGTRINSNETSTWTGITENVEIDLRTNEWFSGASAYTSSPSVSWSSANSGGGSFFTISVVSYGPN